MELSARESGGRGVLEGAFALLDAVQQMGNAGLTKLAAESGLPKATAHRLLEQLADLGAVARSAGRYQMGPQIYRLGQGWQPIPGLREAARRPVVELARATGASVALLTLHDGQAMAIGGVPGEVDSLAPVRSGQVWPWTTAAGKVLVAAQLEDAPLGELPGTWRRELEGIRDRGIAFDHQAIMPGVVCIAVPLRGRGGEVVAALAVLCSPGRRLPQLAAAASRVGKLVSSGLRR
jgi:DNA-binding IclR family transcriptional regulator